MPMGMYNPWGSDNELLMKLLGGAGASATPVGRGLPGKSGGQTPMPGYGGGPQKGGNSGNTGYRYPTPPPGRKNPPYTYPGGNFPGGGGNFPGGGGNFPGGGGNFPGGGGNFPGGGGNFPTGYGNFPTGQGWR